MYPLATHSSSFILAPLPVSHNFQHQFSAIYSSSRLHPTCSRHSQNQIILERTTMPLKISTDSATALKEFLKTTSQKPRFLVIYASPRPNDGLMWCGDCRRAEPLINQKFASRTEDVKVVYAGSESEYVIDPKRRAYWLISRRWRTPSNQYRQTPFSIDKLPTIIKGTGSNVSVFLRYC
jgi:hypothetical protein